MECSEGATGYIRDLRVPLATQELCTFLKTVSQMLQSWSIYFIYQKYSVLAFPASEGAAQGNLQYIFKKL